MMGMEYRTFKMLFMGCEDMRGPWALMHQPKLLRPLPRGIYILVYLLNYLCSDGNQQNLQRKLPRNDGKNAWWLH